MAAPSLDLDWEEGVFRALRSLWRRLVPDAQPFDPGQAAVLEPMVRRLSVLASLVAAAPLRVLPASGDGGLRGDDVLVPPHIAVAPDPEANAALYVLRVVVAGALHRHATPHVPLDQQLGRVVERLGQELPGFLPAWDAACHLQDAAGETVLWGPILALPTSRAAPGETEEPSSRPPGAEAEVQAQDEVVVHQLDDEEALQLPTHAFEKVETAESFNGTMRQLDGEDDLADQLEALEEVNFADVLRGGPEAHSLLHADIALDADIPDVANIQPGERGIPYPEWSARKGRYLADWCQVYPTPLPRGHAEWGLRRRHHHARTIQRLQGELLRHRDRLRGAPRQLDGESVDIDALTRAWSTLRAGRTPSPRLYTRQTRQQRDIATLVLLDVSLSTDAWVGDHRVLDVARDSVLVLGEVADQLGDRLSVVAFASHTRHRVRAWMVRDWNEPWSVGRGRLGSLYPQGYTRIGPALRHGIATLSKVPARSRLLLLVSDGKPTDYDRYEGRHGMADVRQALREAHQQGVRVHALAIDRRASDWLPAMLGPGGWDVLQQPHQLPEAMTRAYARFSG